MQLVILAGGKGTRMGSLTKYLPKPMVMLAGKKILEHQFELALKYNIHNIIILSSYKEDVIREYFKDGKKWGLNIQYHSDTIPLGTAGAIKNIEHLLIDDFVVFYGDTMMDIDLNLLIQYHQTKDGIATLIVHPNDHPHDSDLVDIDKNNQITAFFIKPHNQKIYHHNLVNAALYVLSPIIFNYIKKDTFSDFGKDIFPLLISQNKSLYAYNTTEYIKDIGTVKRLKEVEKDYLSGKIQQLNRINKQKAIFIDRDGVMNYEADPLVTLDKFTFLPGVEGALRILNKSGYLAVLVTNQSIIAKGFATEIQVQKIHNYMESLLGEKGAFLDRVYYCPHHPEKGYKGERKEYKITCKCRKPKTGMIDQAVLDMNIDLNQSFIIGDRTVDIMTGINSRLNTVLIRQGYAGEDKKYSCVPDFIFQDLLEAVQFIVYGYKKLLSNMKEQLPTSIIDKNENPIITIGGLSRSGKSTLSAVVSQHLKQKGKSVKILSLDNWLFPKHQRMPDMNVRDRYQYEIIEKDIKALLNGKKIIYNRYDAKTREITKKINSTFLTSGDILLIDGVIALDHDYIRKKSDISFFTKISKKLREKRFFDFYRYKSLSEEEIKILYRSRNIDEVDIINKSKKNADYIVDMENTL